MPSPDLSRIIYGLPEAVLLLEPEGTIVAANPGAGRLFQQPYAELVGRRLESLVTEDSSRITRFLRLCLRNAEAVPGGFHLRIAGQVVPCRAVGALVHHREQQPQLVWLRLLPRQAANSRFIAYNERLQAAVRELKAREVSEKRWRTAFENSSIGIAVCELDGRFLAANPAYQAMTGYSEEELQGLSFLSLTYDGDREITDHLVRELLQGGERHYQVEKRYRRKNGGLLWVRVNASLVAGSENMPSFLFAVVEDITERKQAEDALRDSERRMRTFFDRSPSLIFIKRTDGRYVYANKEFEKALRIAGGQLKGKRDEDIFPADQAAAFRANDLQVLQAGVPIEFEEISEQADGPHTSIVQKFPLFDREGKVYATGGIATDITRRKQAEKALQHSEHQHRTVVETATDAVVGADENSVILFANPATARIFGYASTELVGQPLTLLMPEYLRHLHEAGMRRYLTTGQRHLNWQGTELTGLRKNGEEFPVEVSFGEIIKNGHRLFTGFIRDISERKQAEQLRAEKARETALRADVGAAFAQEKDLRSILRGCAEAIVRHLDAAFARIWTLNRREQMLELQASAGMYTHLDGRHSRIPFGKLKIGLIAEEQRPHLTNDVVNDSRISDKEWARREGMIAFAGYPLMVEGRCVGVVALFARRVLTTGTVETLATVADSIAQGIERKQAEEKLQDNEHSLRLLTETIPQMLWSATPGGAVDYCNQRVRDYTGISGAGILGAGWMKAVHPDHADAMARAWHSSVTSGVPFQFEFLGRRASDETYRWCLSSALPLRDADGRIMKWYGSVTDLDDWKRAQEALRQSEERFHVLVDGVQDYAIFMLDAAGLVITWNEGAERINGYTAAEIIGRHMSVFFTAAEVAGGTPQQELETAAASGRFEDEGWRIRRDGSRFWSSSIITSIRDERGTLLGFAKVTRDLTERKRLEQALEHERDRLRLLLDLNNRVVSNLDLRQLFQALSAQLRRVMECYFVGLALPDPDGKQLRERFFEYSNGKGKIQEGMVIPTKGSASGMAFRNAQPFLLASAEQARTDSELYGAPGGEALYQLLAADGFKSGCFLPLISRKRVLGVLQLTRREEHAFSQDDIEFLSQVASQIAIAVDNALNYQEVSESRARLAEERSYLEEEIRREHNFDEIVGDSAPLLELLRRVELAAPADSTVLIGGETGTGKELIARAIHSRSARKDRPLVKVNCGSIPASLVESELFGHVKGAFTGATANRTGRFEVANGGTLFLDEVGELPLETQVKLLRVLQEQEFEPVGSSRTIHVKVRIIAATNRDLEESVRVGAFRSDLYYRLNVLPLHVPSLRERRSDIPQLVMFFLERFSKRAGKKLDSVSQPTMQRLISYSWPGNIRELQNIIERGVVLSRSSILELGPDFLPLDPSAARPGDREAVEDVTQPELVSGNAQPSLREVERRHILAVLQQTGGVIDGPKGAAAILQLHPNTLRSRMKKLRIARPGRNIT